MTKTIVVPLDGSPQSATALSLAASLAGRAGAELHLIHVHPQPVIAFGGPTYDLQLDADIERRMEVELQQTAEALRAKTGLRVTATLLEGSTEETLVERIVAERPWLVVLRSHGHGGLRRMWSGSVADSLVRHAGAPVLFAPDVGDAPAKDPADGEPEFQHILLPLDGSRVADEIVEYAAELGEPGRTMFTLLRIVVPTLMFAEPAPTPLPLTADTREIKRREREALGQFERTAFRLTLRGFVAEPQVVVHSQPAAAILAFAAEHSVDLIALSTHGHGGVARAILGSVADKVMRDANVAVLLHASKADER